MSLTFKSFILRLLFCFNWCIMMILFFPHVFYTSNSVVSNWGYLYFCFILISWGCLISPTFFFILVQWVNLIGPLPKKSWNYGGSPKIEDSMESWSASPFGPPIYVRRGWLWAKHIGLNQGAIGNPLGTWSEHVGNKGKMKKIPPTLPSDPKLKWK
jgi:hypothetical protein